SLCRELTKLHEEVLRTTLGGAIAHYTTTPPKGEFVLVIEGAPPAQEEAYTLEDGLELVDKLQAEGASTRDAVKQAAAAYKLSKKALYDLAIARKDGG
ncbi:MAG: 16S rRNA (cytidine(1402)-2'-O)-methyltransferase, partial [Ruminiclostridium sp.]|nr:16S rRNA (cytidine(1402)-2'-O)-methyltransferase [Ruminiclostridium sp.]